MHSQSIEDDIILEKIRKKDDFRWYHINHFMKLCSKKELQSMHSSTNMEYLQIQYIEWNMEKQSQPRL